MKIVVMSFPERKNPCLVLEDGNRGVILATFQNREKCELYKKALDGNCIIIDKPIEALGFEWK